MLNAITITQYHDRVLQHQSWPVLLYQESDPLWLAIDKNHFFNCSLWKEEDQARRKNVPDSEIAANKRAIDSFNQQRNDAVEIIDEVLLMQYTNIAPASDSWTNSETPGGIIDRLSILSLKIHHMAIQAHRDDADDNHRNACQLKLAKLQEQRTDISICFDRFIIGIANGTAHFKIYRQFKMYNDPKTNPYLYATIPSCAQR
ncbi:DUF4254 domain-containing protein [Chrysiogenes arsenatis]|uniref:DUF4254 domain-containing protein n=1 Tax=Chrysiogenes arsenatis TaxID=309797 RepID=UPI000483EFD3|nr:DUF4254 domain-containing protein [Chrysiogenes arsenatis]